MHSDLKIPSVYDEVKLFYNCYHLSHPNPLVKSLAIPTIPRNPIRQLKRNWCRDL